MQKYYNIGCCHTQGPSWSQKQLYTESVVTVNTASFYVFTLLHVIQIKPHKNRIKLHKIRLNSFKELYPAAETFHKYRTSQTPSKRCTVFKFIGTKANKSPSWTKLIILVWLIDYFNCQNRFWNLSCVPRLITKEHLINQHWTLMYGL